jgi:hypothetical protein
MTTFQIVDSLQELALLTKISGFHHFVVHSPTEIADGRSKEVSKTNSSCSSAVRRILHHIPEEKSGYIVTADWKGHQKSLRRKCNKTRKITSIFIRDIWDAENVLDSESALFDDLKIQWGEASPDLVIRLSESCLRSGLLNAGVAVIGLEVDILRIIDEGKKILNSDEIQEEDKAYAMFPIKILSLPTKSKRVAFCEHIMELLRGESPQSPDLPIELAFHFTCLSEAPKEWKSKVQKYSDQRETLIEDMRMLVCVQKYSDKYVVDLPGGKRNLGEGTISALLRETREESGVILQSFTHDGRSDPESGGITDSSQTVICNFEVAKGFQSYVIGIQCL